MCVVESSKADQEDQEREKQAQESGMMPMKKSFDDWWKDLEAEKKAIRHDELAKLSGRKK